MSLNSIYTRTSLLAIFFITLHYTDDVIRKVRGMDQGGWQVLIPLRHLKGVAGEATPGEILASSGPFFVWVVIALALTIFPSLILSAYLLFKPSTEKSAALFKAAVN